MDNFGCISCPRKVRVPLVLETAYLKMCMYKYALSRYHPSVTAYNEVEGYLKINEVGLSNRLANTSPYALWWV
jgi:hypothetical protein